MDLGELVQELRENILHDRSDQIAGSSDYLWSDETLVRYINEAHRRFARDALLLRDGTTPSVTQVPLSAGVTEYALDPSVLAVLSARQLGDTADLVRAGHSALDTYRVPDTYFFDPSSLSSLPPGKPVAFATDEQLTSDNVGSHSVVNMRVYPAPSSTYTARINLRVLRLPLNDFDVGDLTAVPEIPEIHHLEMLDWAAYLALRIVDGDAGDKDRAQEFRTSFEASVKEARKIMMRKLFTPTQWGFGRNGFSWER